MTVADPPKNIKRALNSSPGESPKKLKRVPSSLASQSIPIHFEEPKAVDMAPPKNPAELFDQALGNTKLVQEYSASHADLIRLETEDAWDREAKPRATSRNQADQTERRADIIIRAMREYERNYTFGNKASEDIPGPETLDMGGQFLTNKKRIDNQSLLYKIANEVPKGCLLHLHLNSELNPERLLERARGMENMYIRSIRPLLTQEDLDKTETVFNVLDPELVKKDVNIFSSDYKGNATNWRTDEMKYAVWMPWNDFQNAFEKKFGKKWTQKENTILSEVPRSCSEPGLPVYLHPAENWLKSKMVLSIEEAYGFNQTVNGYVFSVLCLLTANTNAESGHDSTKPHDASKGC
jgi:adenosine deaminase CECR1